MFRQEWPDVGWPFIQWNLVRSGARVFRGVHLHLAHADYLVLVAGEMTIGLKDLRAGSPSEGATALITMREDAPSALVIPPGVAHGFLFREPSIHAYAVSRYWDPANELGCHWQDQELGIPWPIAPAEVATYCLSSRDAQLPGLSRVAPQIPRYRSADAPLEEPA